MFTHKKNYVGLFSLLR